VTDLALPLDRAGIEAIIPHREPFLLVDEIAELVPGEHAVGSYLVRDDAWYLRGHFPGRPIMPGVLQVEALAQVGAVCGLSAPGLSGRLALFAGIDDVRFCRITRLRRPIGKAEATASVAGELACRAALTFALTELDA
jgi:3-hydroxyacyl-[acyl-carrier-protein] dehydratase